MDSKSFVTRIALFIIGFSLLNVAMSVALVGQARIVSNIAGLGLNVALAIFLIAGHGWARWFLAIRCGFGTIFSFVAWSQLATAGFGFFSVVRIWFLFAALASAGIGAYLVLSKRVNEHFNPSSGF